MPPILGSNAVSDAHTERSIQELLYAFYQYWFSGQPRTLGGVTVTFPALPKENYLFNQAQSTPVKTGAQIHTIFTDLRPTQRGFDSAHREVLLNAIFTIYVRVWNPSDGGQSADYECREIADMLKRILEQGKQAIAQLGIHDAKLRRGPVPVPTAGVQTRMLVVTARCSYTSAY